MSVGLTQLGFSGLDAPVGSHIAYTYTPQTKREDHLLDFISTGLKNQEKCVAAVSEYTSEFWRRGLKARGLDPDHLPKGQLDILTLERLTCGSAANSMRAALDLLATSISDSQSEGSKMRVCGSFDGLLYDRGALTRFVAAEGSMNKALSGKNVTVLCCFPEETLHPLFHQAMLQSHSLITDGNKIGNVADIFAERVENDLASFIGRVHEFGTHRKDRSHVRLHDDTPVLHCSDELDLSTGGQMEEQAMWAIRVGHRRLVIDLSETSFIDASSIGGMFRMREALSEAGGKLSIYDPQDHPRKIFQLIHLSDFVPIFTTLDEALSSVNPNARKRVPTSPHEE
jgi:anti-sigma B factor antagonist